MKWTRKFYSKIYSVKSTVKPCPTRVYSCVVSKETKGVEVVNLRSQGG